MRIHTLHPPESRYVFRSIVMFTLILGMLNLALPVRLGGPVRTEARVVTTEGLPLRSETQLRAEAGLFQTAVNEISRISTMRLTTSKELAVANGIIEKHIGNLKYARSKLIAMGFADSTFTSAVKRSAPDKKALEQFGVELIKEPTSIFKVSGGQALGDRMRSALAADTAKIKQVAAVLKKASADVKARQAHHAASSLATSYEPTSPALELTYVDIAFIAIVVAVLIFPPLGLFLLNVSTGVLIVAEVVGLGILAGTLVGNLVYNAAPDEGRDEVAACEDKVDRKYRRCKDDAESALFPDAAKALCYADWLVEVAECWVS